MAFTEGRILGIEEAVAGEGSPKAITKLNRPSSAGCTTGAVSGKTMGATNQKLMLRLMASLRMRGVGGSRDHITHTAHTRHCQQRVQQAWHRM